MTSLTGPTPPDVGMDELDEPFWDACRRGEFLVHVCGECGRTYWPATACLDHGWAPMRWQPGSGRGVVHTYTVVHKAYLPWLAERVPYVLAVVQLDEGPFFHTNVVECAPSDVTVGMRVEMTFGEAADGWVLPYARPATDEGARS